MSGRRYRRRVDGTWLDRGRVLARAVFYGVGWELRTEEGTMTLRVATGSRTRSGALKAVRRLVVDATVSVGDGSPAKGCFHPDYKLGTKCWEFEVKTFEPSGKVLVSSDA